MQYKCDAAWLNFSFHEAVIAIYVDYYVKHGAPYGTDKAEVNKFLYKNTKENA